MGRQVPTARELHENLGALMTTPPPSIKEILGWTSKRRVGVQNWIDGMVAVRRGRALRPPPARTWMKPAPPRDPIPSIPACAVREVVEALGPKGGTIHVMTLACGAWATRRLGRGAPPQTIPCVSCFLAIRAQQQGGKSVVHRRRSDGGSDELPDGSVVIGTHCGSKMSSDEPWWAWRKEDVTCLVCVRSFA